jgi:hypothetical protein
MCTVLVWFHPGCDHHTQHPKLLCHGSTQDRRRTTPQQVVEDAPKTSIICDDCEKLLKRSVTALFRSIGMAAMSHARWEAVGAHFSEKRIRALDLRKCGRPTVAEGETCCLFSRITSVQCRPLAKGGSMQN